MNLLRSATYLVLLVVLPAILLGVLASSLALGHAFAGQVTTVAVFWLYLFWLLSLLSRRPAWRRLQLEAYLFLFPALVVLGIFHILPVFYALKLSFYQSESV